MCTKGRNKSFKIEWKDGHRSGIKVGGTNKGILEERRERNRSRKRIMKTRNGMKGLIQVKQKQDGRAEK
jgi:hypothetical protein